MKNTVLLFLCLMAFQHGWSQEDQSKPNILFIHVDQMHADAMSAMGNTNVKTPSLDKMVDHGYSFLSHYSANPICCPARTSWYTGLMSTEHGVAHNGKYKLDKAIPDLGAWVRDNGDYETAYAGKWHVTGRLRSDGFRVISNQSESKGELFDGTTARACMGFLENYEGDKPFFLNAAFVNPHDCCYSSGAVGGEGKIPFVQSLGDELPEVPANFWTYTKKTGDVAVDKEREDYYRYYIYMYYRWTEMVDAEIGRLYDALLNSRFADNTVVIFTSDHGDGVGFHGRTSKSKMEDESWRVPMIIIPPGRVESSVKDSEHISIGVDVTATICDYAGVSLLPNMTIGKSLRPFVDGETVDDWHEYIVGENWQGSGKIGIRDVQYKSIIQADGNIKIYDMINDPLEMNSLNNTDKGNQILAKHKGYMKEYLTKINLYPVPTEGDVEPYESYMSFYETIKNEW